MRLVWAFAWRVVLLFYALFYGLSLAGGYLFVPTEDQLQAAVTITALVSLALSPVFAIMWVRRSRRS